jgi:hypothetical protein
MRQESEVFKTGIEPLSFVDTHHRFYKPFDLKEIGALDHDAD